MLIIKSNDMYHLAYYDDNKLIAIESAASMASLGRRIAEVFNKGFMDIDEFVEEKKSKEKARQDALIDDFNRNYDDLLARVRVRETPHGNLYTYDSGINESLVRSTWDNPTWHNQTNTTQGLRGYINAQ